METMDIEKILTEQQASISALNSSDIKLLAGLNKIQNVIPATASQENPVATKTNLDDALKGRTIFLNSYDDLPTGESIQVGVFYYVPTNTLPDEMRNRDISGADIMYSDTSYTQLIWNVARQQWITTGAPVDLTPYLKVGGLVNVDSEDSEFGVQFSSSKSDGVAIRDERCVNSHYAGKHILSYRSEWNYTIGSHRPDIFSSLIACEVTSSDSRIELEHTETYGDANSIETYYGFISPSEIYLSTKLGEFGISEMTLSSGQLTLYDPNTMTSQSLGGHGIKWLNEAYSSLPLSDIPYLAKTGYNAWNDVIVAERLMTGQLTLSDDFFDEGASILWGEKSYKPIEIEVDGVTYSVLGCRL